MYSLSRHPSTLCSEKLRSEDQKCFQYHGSHDAYLFVLHTDIKHSLLTMLKFPWGSNGSENVLMWIFRYKLKYMISNPCLLLKMYHLHCTNVRPPSRGRFNERGISVSVLPTDQLYLEQPFYWDYNWFSILWKNICILSDCLFLQRILCMCSYFNKFLLIVTAKS